MSLKRSPSLDYACMVLEMMPYVPGNHLNSLMQKHAVTHSKESLRTYPQGVRQKCFMNSLNLALEYPDLVYVEGYAIPDLDIPIPIHHAWCLDPDRRVVDTTWSVHGVDYAGIPIKTNFASKCATVSKYYSVFFNPLAANLYMHADPKSFLAPI